MISLPWSLKVGVRVQGEECDDGNLNGDDGCNADCTRVKGYFCAGDGQACKACQYAKLPQSDVVSCESQEVELTKWIDDFASAVPQTHIQCGDWDISSHFEKSEGPSSCPRISYLFNLTYSDSGFDHASATFIVTDKTSPVFLTVPKPAKVECDAIPSGDDAVHVTDNCQTTSIAVTFSDSILNGSCSHAYTLTRTWQAVDECNNFNSIATTYSVIDTRAPTVHSGPVDLVLECDGAGNINEIDAWAGRAGDADVKDSCEIRA